MKSPATTIFICVACVACAVAAALLQTHASRRDFAKPGGIEDWPHSEVRAVSDAVAPADSDESFAIPLDRYGVSSTDPIHSDHTEGVAPSEGQRNAYRRVCRLARHAAVELPNNPDLTAQQWQSILELEDDFTTRALPLKHQRGRLAIKIADDRAEAGQMERAQSPPLKEGDLIDVRGGAKPSMQGQVVARRFVNGVEYLIRINPGDSEELDRVNSELSSVALEAAAEVQRIIYQ